MKLTKTPPEIVAKFDAAAPKDPRVVRKPMFGYPALFIGGNMLAGTFRDDVVVRLPAEQIEREIKAKKVTQFAPMAGRPMTGFAVLSKSDVAKPATLAKWIDEARDFAATLPAKAAKPPASRPRPASPSTRRRAR
ncbi:MAG TPA: TfoX/Sxy family protein [Candidatus Limnocylindria bacterium]|nr:TfoX/Sxy family protein [Candidatus Limnocylindria bacterium]